LLPLYNVIRPVTAAEDKYIVDLPPHILHINHIYFKNIQQGNTDVEKISRLWMTKLVLIFFKKRCKASH